ncbi:hypothetical protein, partial [Streptomyces sp. SID1034]
WVTCCCGSRSTNSKHTRMGYLDAMEAQIAMVEEGIECCQVCRSQGSRWRSCSASSWRSRY